MSERGPFANDAEMLDLAFTWLTTRARRLTLDREIRDATRNDIGAVFRACDRRRTQDIDDEAPDRAAALRALEERQHGELHERREAHRADTAARPLGLDRLSLLRQLCEDEEVVVLAALCGAISEEGSTVMFGDLAIGYFGNMTVEGVSRLLDAQTTADRLRIRRMFQDDSPLVKGGVIVVDHLTREPAYPDDLLGARLRLTDRAFATLVGDGPVLSVVST